MLYYVLASLAFTIAIMVAIGANAWFMISIYWVMVFVNWILKAHDAQ